MRDEAGQKSDQLTIDLDDRGNQIEKPRDKARIEVWLGYKETGLVKVGTYEMQSFTRKWGDEGETVTIQASAADLKKQLKGCLLYTSSANPAPLGPRRSAAISTSISAMPG